MRAVQPATSTPRRQARRAADLPLRISRSSAPMAFTVRNDPSERSNAEPMPPTAAWERSVARRIRGTTTSTASPFRASTASVTASSARSITPIRTTQATSMNTALTEWTRP